MIGMVARFANEKGAPVFSSTAIFTLLSHLQQLVTGSPKGVHHTSPFRVPSPRGMRGTDGRNGVMWDPATVGTASARKN